MLLAPNRRIGRTLDPLDAADGGLNPPRLSHPFTVARAIDAGSLDFARRASEPLRVAVSSPVPTLRTTIGTAPREPTLGTTTIALPGSTPSAPEDVTPRPTTGTGSVFDLGKLTPLPVADPTQPARPPVSPAPSSSPEAARSSFLWLAGVAVLVVLLSR